MSTECGSDRPARCSSSSTSSNVAESLDPGRDRSAAAAPRSPSTVAGEGRPARRHPVAVAADRVDLAVVGDDPERLRERPRRERVRREPRVDQRELGGVARVGQVREERLELRRREHALVDQRAALTATRSRRRARARRACAAGRPAGPGRRPRSSRDGSATTSWRNTGMDARAVGPTRSAVTGTSRQARTSSFSSAAIASMRAHGGVLARRRRAAGTPCRSRTGRPAAARRRPRRAGTRPGSG